MSHIMGVFPIQHTSCMTCCHENYHEFGDTLSSQKKKRLMNIISVVKGSQTFCGFFSPHPAKTAGRAFDHDDSGGK